MEDSCVCDHRSHGELSRWPGSPLPGTGSPTALPILVPSAPSPTHTSGHTWLWVATGSTKLASALLAHMGAGFFLPPRLSSISCLDASCHQVPRPAQVGVWGCGCVLFPQIANCPPLLKASPSENHFRWTLSNFIYTVHLAVVPGKQLASWLFSAVYGGATLMCRI